MTEISVQKKTADFIANLQKNLLDLTGRNALLNFKHSERSVSHIRVIDELPDELYATLIEGKELFFNSLKPFPNEPKDEETTLFKQTFESALLTDEEYLKILSDIKKADLDEDDFEIEIKNAERQLKDRVRKMLGLKPLKEALSYTNEKWAEELGINPSYDLPTPNENIEKKHTDNYLQTRLLPKEMEKKLLGLRRNINTDINETGVNTFYAAFGFLEYEDVKSQKKQLAPLIMLPLNPLKEVIKGGKKLYAVSSNGETAENNKTLCEKLKRDFKISLPEFDEENDTPEKYFKKIETLIEDHPSWKIRRFITFGRFQFSRLVMYNDLTSQYWRNGLNNNPLIQQLLVGYSETDPLSDEGNHIYSIDTDEDVEKFAPCLVMDADASQHSAIIEAMKGKNLVIYGPPGTGKSQTIANIIANAIYLKKKVLFVAAKKAALDVVFNRLKRVHLDPFCMQLHSAKSRLKDVKALIEERLFQDYPSSLAGFEEKKKELKKNVAELRKLSDQLNSPVKATGITLFDLLWKWRKKNDELKEIIANDPFLIEKQYLKNVFSIPYSKVQKYKQEILEYAVSFNKVKKFGKLENHPWYDIPYENCDSARLFRTFSIASDRLKELKEKIIKMEKKYDWKMEASYQNIVKITDLLSKIVEETIPDQAMKVLSDMTERENNILSDFFQKLRYYNYFKEKYGNFMADIDAFLDHFKRFEKTYQLSCQEKVSSLDADEIDEKISAMSSGEHLLNDFLKEFENRTSFDIKSFDTRELARISELLDDLPTDFFQIRNEIDLKNKDCHSIVSAAVTQQKILFEEKKEAEQYFEIPSTQTDQKVIEYIELYKKRGLFSFLFPEKRKAKAFIDSILKPEINDKKASFIKQHLDLLGKYFVSKVAFLNVQDYCHVAGSLYKGADTDYKKIDTVTSFFHLLKKEYGKNSIIMKFFENEDIETLLLLKNKFDLKTISKTLFAVKTVNLSELEDISVRIQNLKTISAFYSDNKIERHVPLDRFDFSFIESIWQSKTSLQLQEQILKDILKSEYAGLKTNSAFVQTLTTLFDLLGQMKFPVSSLRAFSSSPFQEMLKETEDVATGLSSWKNDIYPIMEKNAHGDLKAFFKGETVEESSFFKLLEILDFSLNEKDALDDYICYKKLNDRVKQACYSVFIEDYLNSFGALDQAAEFFELVYFDSLLREAADTPKDFAELTTSNLQKRLVEKFKELDEELIALNAAKISETARKNKKVPGVSSGYVHEYTEGGLIDHLVKKTTVRNLTLRGLFKRAPISLQNLFPCFLMSPMSVAQYLQPEKMKFDLVIIDEASQMPLEDALGGVARSKQAVIVGDSQQLPPTSFFRNSVNDDDFYVEDDEDSYIEQEESVLEKAKTNFKAESWLKWHYRSRHESLIAFSNHHFYNDKLTVFPSSLTADENCGVFYEHVEEGVYKARCNEPEARRVIDAVATFIHQHPDSSLGVGTMNVQQQQLLEMMFDELCTKDTYVDEYRREHEKSAEPFFIKNLENIQGDERDTIFISTVYGPKTVKGSVSQRFGPINGAQGHRRLNVLFTRAKKSLRIFSSMHPEDIVVKEGANKGVSVFRDYLEYAASGGTLFDNGMLTDRSADSAFEEFVKEKLEEKGFIVIPQVGVNGYFIDLGIKHEDYPFGYVAGVECDGATYHSSKSARDRDRIRQSVLESLGWSIYRVWSVNWYGNVEGELDKLTGYLFDVIEKKKERMSARSRLAKLSLIDDTQEECQDDKPQKERKKDLKKACVGSHIIYAYNDVPDQRHEVVLSYVSNKGCDLSVFSPLGKVLLGCEEGDIAEIRLDDRIREVTVISVSG